ncbi:MAG TPA: DUF1080 domain-containing protein [Verrucomicrobiae bacterium]
MSTFSAISFFGFILAFAFVSNGLAADLPAPITPTERVDLFNGKDFSGWTFCLRSNAEPAKTFSITNGLMHCTGQPFGYARTEKSYRDYKLTVEWRFVKVAPRADNTGVFVHLQTPDAVWPREIENQGQFHHQGEIILTGGVTAKGYAGPQMHFVKMQRPQNENPVGEWNTYEIICRSDTLENYVNGKLMNEVTGLNVTSGAIAVQSEGGDWELRKIFIEPLE